MINCVIVDDEFDAIERCSNLLHQVGDVRVLSKENEAEKAAHKIIQLKPDLVFMDVEMPIKSGFDVIHEVRMQSSHPTFIMTTGYSQYAIKAIREAAFDFLVKPIDLDELKSAIKRFEEKKVIGSNLPNLVIEKYSLTEREAEIVTLLLEGMDSQEIAEQLFISKHTVDTHRRNILHKTNTENTSRLFALITSISKWQKPTPSRNTQWWVFSRYDRPYIFEKQIQKN